MDTFEVVCSECSKVFETTDQNTIICPKCWEKLIVKEITSEGKEVKR